MVWFFLSSGLFLGWSLGANDAANVFGSAVGSRMVKFRTAAIIAGIFVIIGATFQGGGGAETLGKLGSVDALAGSFTVAFSAAITVFWMTRLKLPVSTSQAVVGGIIGWNLYTGNPTDTATLIEIAGTWGVGILLGALFAILLFLLVRWILNKMPLHLLWRDAFLRFFLIVVGAFGAYSLGANNIANVMGVFVNAVQFPDFSWGIIYVTGTQQLFMLGGFAIAIGIITYSKKVMQTVGESILPLRAETAMVVVLAQALVLFVFSSQGLSNLFLKMGLPHIPMVPVSSSQVIIGAIIGIGLVKSVRNIRFRVLGGVLLGWISTPVIAGIIAFFSLFFVNNVFKLEVQKASAVTNQLPISNPINDLVITYDSLFLSDTIVKPNKSLIHEYSKNENKFPISNFVIFLLGTLMILLAVVVTFLNIRLNKQQKLYKELKEQMDSMPDRNR